MARTQRTYTSELKAEAVKLVTEQGYSIAEAARSLGLSEGVASRLSSGILTVNHEFVELAMATRPAGILPTSHRIVLPCASALDDIGTA